MCSQLRPQCFRPPRNMHTIIMDKFSCPNRPACGAQRKLPTDASYISEDEWDFIRSFSGEMFKNYLLMRQLQQKSGFSAKMAHWLLQEDFDVPIVKPKIVRKRRGKRKNFVKKLPSVPFTKVFDSWEQPEGAVIAGTRVGSVGVQQDYETFDDQRAPDTETQLPHVTKGPAELLMRHGGMKLCDNARRCSPLPVGSISPKVNLFGFAQDPELLKQDPRYIRLQQALAHAGTGLSENKQQVAEELRKIYGRNVIGAFGAQTSNGKPAYAAEFDTQRAAEGFPPAYAEQLRRNTLATYLAAGGFNGAAGDFTSTQKMKPRGGYPLKRNELAALAAEYGLSAIPRSAYMSYGKDELRQRAFEAADATDGYRRLSHKYMDPCQVNEFAGSRKYMNLRQVNAFQTSNCFEFAGPGKYVNPRQFNALQTSNYFEFAGPGKYVNPRQANAFQTSNGFEFAGPGKYVDAVQSRAAEIADVYQRIAAPPYLDARQINTFEAAGGYARNSSLRYMDPRYSHAFETAGGGGGQARPGTPDGSVSYEKYQVGGFERVKPERVTMPRMSSRGARFSQMYTDDISLFPLIVRRSLFLNSDQRERISSAVTRSSYKRPYWSQMHDEASQRQRRVYDLPNWSQLISEERLKYQSLSAAKRELSKELAKEPEEFKTMVQDLDSFYSVINTGPPTPVPPLNEIPSGDTELNLKEIVDYLKMQPNIKLHPVVYHEPFDRMKPWTWMQNFPAEIPQQFLNRVSKHSLAALKAWQHMQDLMMGNQQLTVENSSDVDAIETGVKKHKSHHARAKKDIKKSHILG